MGRSKDLFWEFVEDLNGCFECKFCGSNFAMSATRIYIYIYIFFFLILYAKEMFCFFYFHHVIGYLLQLIGAKWTIL